MTPAVSVVVVTWNRRELLARCLASLAAQTYRDFETVVVDNGSKDGTAEHVRSLGREDVQLVALPSNRGFSAGCNAGIGAARGRYVATLNNDAEAEPRWLEELVRPMDADPAVGMCAAKILFHADRRYLDKAGHALWWDGLNHGRGCGEEDRGQYDEPGDALFPDGAAALYRKAMLDAIGGFDERFFAYGDDCDLGLRGRLAGWRCAYVAAAVVLHVHSATAGEYSALKARLIERNRIWVLAKHFPLPLVLLSPAFTAVRLAAHALGALLGIGLSGRFAAAVGRGALVAAVLRAWTEALAGLPGIWRTRRSGGLALLRLLLQHRAPLWSVTLGP